MLRSDVGKGIEVLMERKKKWLYRRLCRCLRSNLWKQGLDLHWSSGQSAEDQTRKQMKTRTLSLKAFDLKRSVAARIFATSSVVGAFQAAPAPAGLASAGFWVGAAPSGADSSSDSSSLPLWFSESPCSLSSSTSSSAEKVGTSPSSLISWSASSSTTCGRFGGRLGTWRL